MIRNAQRKFRVDKLAPSAVHPRVVLNTVRDICDQLIVVSEISTQRVLQEVKLAEAALLSQGRDVSDCRNALVSPVASWLLSSSESPPRT